MSATQQVLLGLSAGAAALDIAYIGSTLASGANTNTFSGHSIGTASDDRYIVVAISFSISAGRSFAACTVGGAATTILKHTVSGLSSNGHGEAIIVITDDPVTSGTSADIVVTQGGSAGGTNGSTIGVYALTGLSSTSATHTAGTTVSGSGGTGSMSIGVSDAGGTIAVMGAGGYSGSGFSNTWNNITQRYAIDGYPSGVGQYSSGASILTASAATLSLSCATADTYYAAFSAVSIL